MVPAVPPAVSAAPHHSGLRDYFANIWRAAATIFEGLSVTMSWMFRRPLTIQYPDKIEEPVQEMLPEGYRGVLEVDLNRCIGCVLCSRTCPIGCLKIEVRKNPETGVREIVKFDIDIGSCMYCGLCSEACETGALIHTTQFEAALPRAEQLVLHFVKEPVPTAKHKPGEGPERRPAGSILAEVLPEFGRRAGRNRWLGRRRRAHKEEKANQPAAQTASATQPAASTSATHTEAPAPASEERKDG